MKTHKRKIGLGRKSEKSQHRQDNDLFRQIRDAVAANQRDEVFHLAAQLVTPPVAQPRPDPLTIEEFAKEVRVSTRTLWRLLGSDKTFPQPFRVGGSLRWRRVDIEKFKAQPNSR
jgi:predicted DNA-binding transcriptional regulator AlpA